MTDLCIVWLLFGKTVLHFLKYTTRGGYKKIILFICHPQTWTRALEENTRREWENISQLFSKYLVFKNNFQNIIDVWWEIDCWAVNNCFKKKIKKKQKK